MPIELINTTPWNTEELTEFLVPLFKGTDIETVRVCLLLAQPGTPRKDQPLYEVNGVGLHDLKTGKQPSWVRVEILSPKRAAARTDLLDRMAQVDDLAIHEIALPEKIAGGVSHALRKLTHVCRQKTPPARLRAIGDEWGFRKHLVDEPHQRCDCSKTLKVYPIIRGNTRTRTAPPVDIDRLKRRGRWALEAAEKYREKMEHSLAVAQKLGARIRKLEAKAWDDASKGKGH